MIKQCLEQFEAASGQRISLHKSHIFFSRNVDDRLDVHLCVAGVTQMGDLDRYLGVPSLHGHVTTRLFTPMMERIEAKLQGWKNMYLSLVERRVLAQSALSTIHFYTMQTVLLPVGVCDEIERKIRKFLWGSRPTYISLIGVR